MKKKFPVPFTLVVIIPVIITAVYYMFFASKQYVVETKYIIQSHQQPQSDLFGAFAGLAGMSSSPSVKDAYIAQQYIWSAELLNKLDKEINVRKHYSDSEYDWWARLAQGAPLSDYLDYWEDAVDIEFDSSSGITTLSVTAFTAEQAQLIAEKLLDEAEKHVNKLSDRARTDSLNLAKKELKVVEEQLLQSRIAVTNFRNIQKEIDPEQTTAARLELVTGLESKLTEAQAELSNLAAFMKADAFQIRSLKNKVAVLKRQIRAEHKRWGSTKENTNTLSARIAEYEILKTKKIFAEKLYESALGSLESARLSAIQQQQYLEVVTQPYKPSEAEKPYVVNNMISVILGSIMFWAIGTLIISAVKDHA